MKLLSLSFSLVLFLSPALHAASPPPATPETIANPQGTPKPAPHALKTPPAPPHRFNPHAETPPPPAVERSANPRDLLFSRADLPSLPVSALGIVAPSVAAPAAKSSPVRTTQAGTDFLAARDPGSISVSGHTIDPASRKMATDPFQVSIEHITRRDSLLDVLERALNPLPTGEGPFSSSSDPPSTGLRPLPYAFTAPSSR